MMILIKTISMMVWRTMMTDCYLIFCYMKNDDTDTDYKYNGKKNNDDRYV